MKPLRLKAQDSDDLQVIASALQDAVVAVDTLRYNRSGMHFTLRGSRFRHESGASGAGTGERVLTGLRVDGVTAARTRGIDRSKPDSFTVLLDIAFDDDDAADAIGGTLNFTFAGGGAIALDVEALDILLADVGEPRPVSAIPSHEQG